MKIAIIGAGLSGGILASLTNGGHDVTVFEKRKNIGGNCSDKLIGDVLVQEHGAHIFHTNNEMVWNYVNNFADFNNYVHKVKATNANLEYNLSVPINMKTFEELLYKGINVEDVKKWIGKPKYKNPKNFKEACINKYGEIIYEKIFKNYSEKQWGRKCEDIPKEIVDRLPLRFKNDDRYFTDKYQGMPIGGYSKMISNMFGGSNILKMDVGISELTDISDSFDIVFFSGEIDKLFDYTLGSLEYRSLSFDTTIFRKFNKFAKSAVTNFVDECVFTRMIDWTYFYDSGCENITPVTFEKPMDYDKTNEPYYPINDKNNNELHQNYLTLLKDRFNNVVPLGRLAEYKYFDMDKCVENSFKKYRKYFGNQ